MSKVLYIKANIKEEGQSRTFQVSDHFIEAYQKNHPEDEIMTLDLYKEDIDFLRPQDLGAVFGPKSEESKQHPVLKYTYQFKEADKYIFAAPMWNLSMPAILKAYLDYVSVTGITFHYTANGPEGLLKDKKAIHITSRGGIYSGTEVEMGDRYLRTLLQFFGIQDITTLAVEGVDIMGNAVAQIVAEKQKEAEILANQF